MAVSANSTSNYSNSSVSYAAFSHAMNAGNNRVLFVFVMKISQDISSVTFDSIALTEYSSISYFAGAQCSLFYLINPPQVTADIEITLSGTDDYLEAVALCLNGVDQSTPFGNESQATDAYAYNLYLGEPSGLDIDDGIIILASANEEAATGHNPVLDCSDVTHVATTNITNGSIYSANVVYYRIPPENATIYITSDVQCLPIDGVAFGINAAPGAPYSQAIFL